MQRAEIIVENGVKKYKRVCLRCKKTFIADRQTQIYCSEQCKIAYNKRKKSKNKSGKRYTKTHSVSRALEGAARNLSRRMATLALKPIDYLTGETLQSWDLAQIHHIDLNMFNTDLSNLAILTATSHAEVHQKIREKFGKDIDKKLYVFGRADFNFSTKEDYLEFRKLRDEVVDFEKSLFKVEFNQPIPEFNEKA